MRRGSHPRPGTRNGLSYRTELASICGSDLHICYMGWNVYEWPLPHGYPGHEGVGVVVDGNDTGFQEGEIVLTAPNIWSSRTFAGYQLIDPKFLLRLPSRSSARPSSHGAAAWHGGVRLPETSLAGRQDRRGGRAGLGRTVPRLHAQAHRGAPHHSHRACAGEAGTRVAHGR